MRHTKSIIAVKKFKNILKAILIQEEINHQIIKDNEKFYQVTKILELKMFFNIIMLKLIGMFQQQKNVLNKIQY